MKKITLCINQVVRYLILFSVLLWVPLTSHASQLVYTIQSGSFVQEADAQKQFDSLKKGLSEKDLDYLRIEKVGKYYSVRIGNHKNRDSAEKYLEAMGPHLSGALLTKAYIKDERVKRIYRAITSDSKLIFTIQSGSFVREADAQKQFDSLKQGLSEKDLDHLRIEKIGKYYSVRIGNHKNRDSAEKYLETMSPHLSGALLTKAYIKDERVKKMYKGYLSFDEPAAEEMASSDVEPEKAVIPANVEPVNQAETEMYAAASPSVDTSDIEEQSSSDVESEKAVILANVEPVNQAETEMYSAASPSLDTPEVEKESSSDVNLEEVVLWENEKPVNQAETEMYSADHENREDMYAQNDYEAVETEEFQFAELADMSLDLDGLDIEGDAEEYKFPEIAPEAALFAGYRFIEHGGSARALEYEYRENHPVFGGDWRSFKHPNMMHFDLDFKNNKDYEADLRYGFKSMVNFRWFNSTLFHNLDNIELMELDPTNGTKIDNRNVGEDFGVKVAFNVVDLKLKPFDYPFHVYFKGFHRRRSGEQQQRSLLGSGYHNDIDRITQDRNIDWRTKDFVVGSNIHLGALETDISHREKRFDVGGDEQLIDTYTSAGFGPPCASRCAGTYPHNLTPQLSSTSNKIKIHTSLTGKLVASASFTKKDGMNRDSGASTDIFHGTGAVTYRPLTNLSFFAKYSHRELDRINPSEVSITTLDTGIKKTYTNLKPSISSTTDTASITGKYNPIQKVTLRAKYYYRQKERDNAELWLLADEVSRKNEVTFYASTRVIKKTEIKADYTHGWASDPLYNVEPNRSDRGSISLSWIPTYRMNFLVSYRKAQEDRSGLGFFDTEEPESRETSSDNAFASGTFQIVNNLSLTTSYAYMRYKILQDIENHDGGGAVFTDFDVPMEERAHLYSASLNYVPVEYVRLLAEINHTESDSEWRTNLDNITLPESLATFSEQKIRETDYRVSGDFDCISNGSCSIEFQYSNFDDVIDNIHDDNEDGNAYIVYLKFMKRWE